MNLIASLLCSAPLIIVALLGLGFLVVFHEFGHFIFCKIFDVRTPSFSIGFGPRLFEKQIGETVFKLSAIPFGGYVEMAGSPEVGQGEQLYAKSKDSRSFNSKPYWQKMLIISGGIIFNILLTYIILTLLLYLGTPCIGSWCEDKPAVVGIVVAGSPAEKAGLKANDQIVAINSKSVSNIKEFTKELEPFANKNAQFEIKRDGTSQTINIDVGSTEINKKVIPRVGVYWHAKNEPFGTALVDGWKATVGLFTQTINALKGLFKARDSIGGPLMIITQMAECAGIGYKVFLFMLAFISINLAVFNLLPLPIFDGGQALFYTIEALSGKPLSDEVRYKIHYYTWLMIIALVVYITYRDLVKIVKPYISKEETKVAAAQPEATPELKTEEPKTPEPAK